MIENVFLFEAFDIRWTLVRTLLTAGAALMAFALVVCLPFILIRHGRVRAMTEDELAYMGRRGPGEVRMHYIGARGVRIEAKASIDTLRRLAKRGDWLLFCAWPCGLSAMGVGMALGCAGIAVREGKGFIYWYLLGVAAFLVLLFVGIGGLFMPWAALYTNIDLDADGPDPDNPLPVGPLPPVPDPAPEGEHS